MQFAVRYSHSEATGTYEAVPGTDDSVTSKTVVKTMANGVSTALFVAALLPAASAQQTIVVGGSDGWVVKPGNAAYDDIIANGGDTLQFTYSSWYHDVSM